ncbi:hypothetical protein F2Q70_00019053 [Brassica cretica]|uniref:Uncharacterized protein n=1 Tax=Brassica cretica TaxID=69181 RepID=A0A3N6RC55_BRACR|nr:hypothetical protein F2Q70_00019053 [Brassica cretica]KAF2598883.1 hypothetical protein F2Q68_00012618 [Brassica cretica]
MVAPLAPPPVHLPLFLYLVSRLGGRESEQVEGLFQRLSSRRCCRSRSESVLKSKRFSIWSGLYGGLGWFGRSPSPVKIKGLCSPRVILFAASNCRSQALAVSTLSTLGWVWTDDYGLRLSLDSCFNKCGGFLLCQWKYRLNVVRALRSLPTWFLVLWIGNIFKSTNKLP